MIKRICILLVILPLAVVLTGCSENGDRPDTAATKPQPTANEPKQEEPEKPEREWRTVKRVIDGDTIELENGETVKLIGVDAPESSDCRVPVEHFGQEATEFTHKIVGGKKVRLKYGLTRKDNDGLTLAYVYCKIIRSYPFSPKDTPDITKIRELEEEVVLNKLIIKQGYGRAGTEYPHKYLYEYQRLEREAKEAKRGLWAQKKPQTVLSEEEIFKQYMIPPEARGFTPLEHHKRVKHLVSVFINGTDGFYHRPKCSSLTNEEGKEGKSKIRSIYLGVASGRYKPCLHCKPPELVTVYINGRDGLYHRGDCSYLRGKEGKTKIRSIFLGLVSGIYKPCPHCKPLESTYETDKNNQGKSGNSNNKDSNRDQYKDFRKSRKKEHDYEKWVDKISSEQCLFIKGINISSFKFEGLLLKEHSSVRLSKRFNRTYLVKSDGTNKSIKDLFGKIIISECSSVREAHESIIDYMITCTIPKFPTGQEKGIEIGDICFTSFDSPPTGIVFARNNVRVNVRLWVEGLKQSLANNNELHKKVANVVKKIASTIDKSLSTQKKDSVRLSDKFAEITKFEVIGDNIEAGKEAEITLTVKAQDDKDVTYILSTSKEGRFYERDGKYFVIFKQQGTYKVSVSVTTRNGDINTCETEVSVKTKGKREK